MSESGTPLTSITQKSAKYEKSRVGLYHASTFGRSEATTGLLEPLTDPNIKIKQLRHMVVITKIKTKNNMGTPQIQHYKELMLRQPNTSVGQTEAKTWTCLRVFHL